MDQEAQETIRVATHPSVLLPIVVGVVLLAAAGTPDSPEPRHTIAKAFEGTHLFHYLFVEDGVPYLDTSAHMQVVETEDEKKNRVTHAAFYHHTAEGKRLHFRYVIHGSGNKVTLTEFDARGAHRFDCVGTYQPEERRLECTAQKTPKPARDLDGFVANFA